jgi:hypothetical protein
VNHVNFTHDFNPGMGPAVSRVDSGNGFGTRVFWTAVIPDSDVQVNLEDGTAEMHIRNLPELDYFSPTGQGDLASLGPTWQTGSFDSVVSIDVVWNGPVTRRVNVRDAANGFAGHFNENQATVTWSANSTSGFSFTSNPGNFSTSVPETPGVNGVTAPLNFFAQVGKERNGVFFPAGDPVLATSTPQDPVQQTLTTEQLQPVLQTAIAGWQAAGASASQVAMLNGVQVHIAALPTSRLGEEAGGEIWISPNADGWGWYTDASPASNQAFPATPGNPAFGQMDLLSVVNHELGHVLGLEDSQNTQDVMGATLAPGVRRLPTTSDVLATGVEPTAASPASTAAFPAVAFVSSSLGNHSDQDLAALWANIWVVPAQTMSAPPVANPAPAALSVPFGWQPPALLDARSQNSGTTLSLTPLSHASSTELLDQVFAAVAAKPVEEGLFSNLLVLYSG